MLRLREAKRLLLYESVNVARVADMLGFASASHFCSQFGRAFGITPTEFVRTGRMSEYELG